MQHAPGAPPDLGRPPRRAQLRSAAILLVILVGLPVVAFPADGPAHLLDVLDLLRGRVGVRPLGALLLVVLWLLWLQVAAVVLVEAVSGLRGAGLPPRVPFATARQQAFARRHVEPLVAGLTAPSPGPASRTAPAAPAARPPVPARAHQSAARSAPDAPPRPVPTEPVPPAPATPPVPPPPADRPVRQHAERPAAPLRWDLVGAELLSDGLLGALDAVRARTMARRLPGSAIVPPDDDAAAADASARLGADPAGAAFLDRALRALGGGLAAAGRPQADLRAVRLTGDVLEVVLARPRTDAPPPFTAEAGGRRWVVARDAALPAAGTIPFPAPALVSLGGDGVGRVLVDLESFRSAVCVDGAPQAARAVVAAAALELLTARWTGGTTVTLVGFGAGLAALGGRRVRCADSLDEVVDEITDRLSASRQALLAAGEPAAVDARVLGVHPAATAVEVVVLAAPPAPEVLAELTAWLVPAPARTPLAVLVAGAVPGARWRLALDGHGILDIAPLGVAVGAQALAAGTCTAIERLVAAEGRCADEPLRPAPPARPVPAAPPVVLQLFGPPAVHGVAPAAAVDLEVVAHLALHGAVVPERLAAAVWPGGIRDAERAAVLARVQSWLGPDAAGRPRLRTGDGRLELSEEVQLDWHLFLARIADGDDAAALSLLRGAPGAGLHPRSFAWLARCPLARELAPLAADVAHRVAGGLALRGDLDGALSAVQAGLRAAPRSGALWDELAALSERRFGSGTGRRIRETRAAVTPAGEVAGGPAP